MAHLRTNEFSFFFYQLIFFHNFFSEKRKISLSLPQCFGVLEMSPKFHKMRVFTPKIITKKEFSLKRLELFVKIRQLDKRNLKP